MKASMWYDGFLNALEGSHAVKGTSISNMKDRDWTHHVERMLIKLGEKNYFNQWVICRN